MVLVMAPTALVPTTHHPFHSLVEHGHHPRHLITKPLTARVLNHLSPSLPSQPHTLCACGGVPFIANDPRDVLHVTRHDQRLRQRRRNVGVDVQGWSRLGWTGIGPHASVTIVLRGGEDW